MWCKIWNDIKIKISSDTNECEEADNTCNNVGSECVNTIGSYTCKCRPGFLGNGKECKGT